MAAFMQPFLRMKFPKLSPMNAKIPYPDHVKLPLDPAFKNRVNQYSGESSRVWDISDGEQELVDWLDKNVGKIHGYQYKFPMNGDGWALVECHHLDHNPDDYGWRRQNPYKPQGDFGYFLVIDDDHHVQVTELILNGVLEKARVDLPRSWK